MAHDGPNILFVTTDHLRRDVAGTPGVAPAVRSLAARGVEFANAYCPSPLCMPSRNSIVTGQFPSRHGICGNMNEPLAAEQRADTYLTHLQEAGYHTALVGKHHFVDCYGLGVDDPDERENLVGDPGAAAATRRLTERLCSRLIRRSNETHEKEQMRVQGVRV